MLIVGFQGGGGGGGGGAAIFAGSALLNNSNSSPGSPATLLPNWTYDVDPTGGPVLLVMPTLKKLQVIRFEVVNGDPSSGNYIQWDPASGQPMSLFFPVGQPGAPGSSSSFQLTQAMTDGTAIMWMLGSTSYLESFS